MGVVVAARLVGILRLLGLQSDTALVVALNRDGLIVDEASVLLGVLVGKVERIA